MSDPEAVSSDGRVERGNQTRRAILRRAADLASLEGLGGLTIGRLAAELSLSKSGVFALFGSKEELQLATVRAARRIFVDHVIAPAMDAGEGLARVRGLCASWTAYSRDRVFPGGCFFFMVGAEFGSRPGQIRDALAAARSEWVAFVEEALAQAVGADELRGDTDVPQTAFELIAFLENANGDSVLGDDLSVYERAARGVERLLVAAAP